MGLLSSLFLKDQEKRFERLIAQGVIAIEEASLVRETARLEAIKAAMLRSSELLQRDYINRLSEIHARIDRIEITIQSLDPKVVRWADVSTRLDRLEKLEKQKKLNEEIMA
tara:strand:+ start:605 stop:937 length:333 start_codon:yes stop_codon:yes gene_type:complete